ncbi:hypothetical protein [Polynucleobacter sp. AP-Kaivos-20-H2]|uniref:hypothetical protein n=1 Tax=Polynucleobacter sp. AP-Kaivos-20-H2 TaxID=2689104 RepID=UPI001C0B6514|nr:hypothetical protein [Polynucleobacter sp. AP-Kaivos-20-H2]MBU3604143.1 hypothetical protein [Polynucleobacter sp. AP-Kaivos-20-H2]
MRILFISSFDSYFQNMKLMSESVKSAGNQAVIFFPREYPNVFSDIEECQISNIDYISWVSDAPVQLPTGNEVIKSLKNLFDRLGVLKIWNEIFRIMAIRKKLKELLTLNKINLMVMGGDIVGHDMAHYINVGHALAIRSVLAPQWFAGSKEPAETISHLSEYRAGVNINGALVLIKPRWKFKYGNVTLIRLPAWRMLILSFFGVNSPNPWVLHSGYSDAILVESEAAKSYALNLGIPRSKLIVVGSMSHDILYKGLQNLNKLDAPLGRSALCALPPNMFYDLNPARRGQFTSYEELVKFWIERIRIAFGSNFLVCIHPSSGEEVGELLKKFNAPYTMEKAINLIPHFDVYIASISATIQWALVCGIPVINYDVYGYNYPDYEGLDGVWTVVSKEDFGNALCEISLNDSCYKNLRERQKDGASDWGHLDGLAHSRIHDALKNIYRNGVR